MSGIDSFDQNTAWSKAWLTMIWVFFLGYYILNILRIFKRKAQKENFTQIFSYLDAFIYVLERDMMPVFWFYMFWIILGGFYVVSVLAGFFLIVPVGILTFAYGRSPQMNKLIMIGKATNLGFVWFIMMVIWIDSLTFH